MSASLKIESGSGLIVYLRGTAFVGLCLGYVQRGLFQLTLQLASSGDNPATPERGPAPEPHGQRLCSGEELYGAEARRHRGSSDGDEYLGD